MTLKTGGWHAAACALLIFFPWAAWPDTTTPACAEALSARIPARQPAASSATDLLRRLAGVNDDDREMIIRDEMLTGNVPQFLRRLIPVVIRRQAAPGSTLTLCVLPDYLSVGSDPDFVITPLRLKTALAVARDYGFLLPTPKVVDAIYRQARIHMTPQPLPASDQMRSTSYLWQHNAIVATQRAELGDPLGVLIAGHKKDLVITNRLWDNLARVAIYGWHRADGRPIQPLSTVHGERYADYSHGVRLVSETAYVDGRATPLIEVLQDPQWAASLSDDGPIRHVADLMRALAEPPEHRVGSAPLDRKTIGVGHASRVSARGAH
jgi:hypothetical protein